MTIYTDPEENEDYGFVFPPHGHRPPEIRYPRPRHRHRHHHPLVSTPLGMGPRGPQGETFTFDDLTDEQLAELREDVASVYHRKLESVYTTTGESTSQIPIPWDNFDPEKDMLFVRIEGLWLHANEYTVSDGNIVLTTPITHAGTAVGITMITTVAMSVEDLENLRGEDGFSPTVTMVRQDDGTLLSITDADGTTSALIPDGAIGPTGQTGPVGPAGPQGPKGDKGDKGDVGPTGPKGQKGDKGDKGDAGLQGPKGDTGDQGPQGVTGPVGPQGQKGDTGDTGPAGVSPTASVERVEGGALVTVTDASGTTTAMLNDAEVTEGSVTDAMLATDGIKAQVAQLWANQLTKELSGTVLTAADAYAAPPVALTVEGKSTQDGTPTPDAPVEISSIEQIELNFAGKNLIQLTNVPVTKTERGITSTWDGTSLKATGEQSQQNAQLVYVEIPFCAQLEAEKQYTFSLQGTYQGPTSTTLYLSRNDGTQFWVYASTAGKWTIIPSYDFTITGFILRIGASSGYVNINARPMLELGTNATSYEPYNATNILLNLTQALRSLPDGTYDTLSLTYLRPSTREGWAWYGATLTQAVGKFIATSPNGWVKSSAASNGYYKSVAQITDGLGKISAGNGIMSPWFKAASSVSEYLQTVNSCWVDRQVNFNIDPATFSGTALEFGAWVAEHNIEFYMPLANPITTTLDPIELPILPAPDVTVWCDPSTGLQMEYVRDTNIAYAQLEAALADLATS